MNASLFPNDGFPNAVFPDSGSPNTMPVVAILAGGLATRLHPLTAVTPKSMVLMAGEPFIAHQLRLLSRQGLRDVVICGGHLAEQIQEFTGDGHRFGCRVRYSCDGPLLRGTGGAIRKALPLLGQRFFVLYGDSYLTAPFFPVLEAFAASGKPAMMTILRNRGQWDASNIEFASGNIVRYDKRAATSAMEHIDYGLSLFSAKVFAPWPESSAFGLSEVQESLVAQRAMAAFEVRDRFYEIGSLQGLYDTDRFLRTLAAAQNQADAGPRSHTEAFVGNVSA
jgi:NDP-sugar pyrophosphorylase family protein